MLQNKVIIFSVVKIINKNTKKLTKVGKKKQSKSKVFLNKLGLQTYNHTIFEYDNLSMSQ